MKTYPVVEIFDSIQGEGSWIGIPVTFIRLGGCNLKCWFCDTKFDKSEQLSLAEILERVHYTNVVITGGEPLLNDLRPLVEALKADDPLRHVAVETNGTAGLPLETRALIDWVVCSPKADNMYRIHPELMPDELKYVVTEGFDPEVIAFTFGNIWLQPEGSTMKESWQECYRLAMKYPKLRVGVQLHKLMEVE